MKIKKKELLESVLFFYLPVLAIIGVGIFYWFNYLHSTDFYSYIQIATNISEGKIGELVNGYWSPVYPALIAILYFVGIGTYVAPIVLYLILFTVGIYFLPNTVYFKKNNTLHNFVITTIVTIVYASMVLHQTPDLLNFFALIYFFDYLIRNKFDDLSGKKLGIIYVVLSLVRYYNIIAIPIVLIGYLIFQISHNYRNNLKSFFLVFKKHLPGFLIISASFLLIWSLLIYNRYGIFHPLPIMNYTSEYTSVRVVHPFSVSGYIENYQIDIPSWYDPIYYYLNEYQNKDYYKIDAEYNLYFRGLDDVTNLFLYFNLLIVLIYFLAYLFYKKKIVESDDSSKEFLFLFLSFLYILGYVRHVIELRYVLILYFAVMMILTSYVFSCFNNKKRNLISIFIIFLILYFNYLLFFTTFHNFKNISQNNFNPVKIENYIQSLNYNLKGKNMVGIIDKNEYYFNADIYYSLAYFSKANLIGMVSLYDGEFPIIESRENVDYYLSVNKIDQEILDKHNLIYQKEMSKKFLGINFYSVK